MTPLATRIMEIINRRPATANMLIRETGADKAAMGNALGGLYKTGAIEQSWCHDVFVYHIPTPKPSKPRPRTPRAPRVKKSKLHPGILELMKRQGKA